MLALPVARPAEWPHRAGPATEDHLHDVVDRVLLAPAASAVAAVDDEQQVIAASDSNRRRQLAGAQRRHRLASSGGSWSGRSQPISPPTAAVADFENCWAIAENLEPWRICCVRRFGKRPHLAVLRRIVDRQEDLGDPALRFAGMLLGAFSASSTSSYGVSVVCAACAAPARQTIRRSS